MVGDLSEKPGRAAAGGIPSSRHEFSRLKLSDVFPVRRLLFSKSVVYVKQENSGFSDATSNC